jgi:hypothetical protein
MDRDPLPATPDLRVGPFSLRGDLRRLLEVHALGAHEATALYAGRILEALSAVAVEVLHVAPGAVFANLTVLEQTGFLPRPWADLAHALRRTGNDARHLRRELGAGDGDLSLALVDRWMEWFFVRFPRRPSSPGGRPASRLGPESMHARLEELCGPSAEIRPADDPSPVLAALRAERLIDAQRFTDADRVLEAAVHRFPEELRLKQLRGLWLSRRGAPGDLEAAEALLEPLVSGGRSGDEEFLGILAGVLRRRWRVSRDPERLERAARLYRAGFRASGGQNAWLGTSAAAGELLLGRTRQAVAQAEEMRALLDRRALVAETVPVWWRATRAEAGLVAGRLDEAWEGYRDVLGRTDLAAGQLLSTREQLADLLGHLGVPAGPEEWLAERPRPVLRVGVVGHRKLPEPEELRPAIRAALVQIRETWTRRPLILVSSLAEGADRLVVEVGREEPFRAGLEALLPLRPEEFRRDFPDARPSREFDWFLGVARDVRVARGGEHLDLAAPGARDRAYAAAASELVDRSEVLLAVWDGAAARGPGGTAETVALARRSGKPLAWIHSADPGSVAFESWP